MGTVCNENELVEMAKSGDQNAFSQLMGAYRGSMLCVAQRVCGNREDAQDCVQNAMLRVFKGLHGFRGQCSFFSWVYRITVNVCLDDLRRRKKRPFSSLDDMLEAGWSPADETYAPERFVLEIDRRNALREALLRLPPDMRTVVILRDVQGRSYGEISSLLSLNEGTVKSRINRGRTKLHQLLYEQAELWDA